MTIRRQFLQVSASLLLLTQGRLRADPGTSGRPIIRLGVIDVSFHRVTASIIGVLLSTMGFEVWRTYALHEEIFDKLHRGEVDMVASAWLPSSHDIYKKKIEKDTLLEELGLHYTPYIFWGVPDYVPPTDLATIDDLSSPSVSKRMNLKIQGVGVGAGVTRLSLQAMEAYGLKSSGYEFLTGTLDDCVNAFIEGYARKEWLVIPFWWPQYLHHQYKIRELKDSKGVLGGKDRAVLLARQDRLHNLLNPDQIKVLNKIRLSNDIISELDFNAKKAGDYDTVAAAWLQAHPEFLNLLLK